MEINTITKSYYFVTLWKSEQCCIWMILAKKIFALNYVYTILPVGCEQG